MTDTIDAVTADEVVDQQQLAEQLLAQAKAQGVELVGPGGLLNQLTKRVLETALEAEMSEHLGYDKHDRSAATGGNSRNGARSKTVLTEIGPVEIDVPRDTDASFEPQIVKKRQRRLTGVDRDRVVADRKGFDHRGDLRALRRGLRRVGLARRRSPRSPTRWSRR